VRYFARWDLAEAEAERPNGRARYLNPPTRVELHFTVKRTEAAPDGEGSQTHTSELGRSGR
jgi:hypothetical protein